MSCSRSNCRCRRSQRRPLQPFLGVTPSRDRTPQQNLTIPTCSLLVHEGRPIKQKRDTENEPSETEGRNPTSFDQPVMQSKKFAW